MLQRLGCKHLRVNSSFQAGLTHWKLINKGKLEHKDKTNGRQFNNFVYHVWLIDLEETF